MNSLSQPWAGHKDAWPRTEELGCIDRALRPKSHCSPDIKPDPGIWEAELNNCPPTASNSRFQAEETASPGELPANKRSTSQRINKYNIS